MEETEEDTRSQREVIIHTVILALTTALSVAGNSLVCVAFYRNTRLRTISNFYVLTLAATDLMFAIWNGPFHTIASGLRRWPFSHNFCQFTGFVTQYVAQISLCILALAGINRYFCVVKPHKYTTFFTRKRTLCSILFVWILLFAQTVTQTILAPVTYRWFPNVLYCRATLQDKRAEKIFYVFYGCLFILPLLIVVFCYGKIYRVVKIHNTVVIPTLQQANSCGTLSAQDIKTSKIIFAAVFGFCVCWTPTIVTIVLEFGYEVHIPPHAQPIYTLFAAISAWINPLIYGVMNRAMRTEFRKIFFCRKD